MGPPAKWIFVTAGITLGLGALVVVASPSLRGSITSGWEVRELLRFRERFRPENVGKSCPNSPLYRIAACARTMILEEDRLHHASMTARIYYLSTVAEVAVAADEFARTRTAKAETRADLLEYLNEEMKALLVRTGGRVDLTALDARAPANSDGSPEERLAHRYSATLVDLWIKNWRKDEKYFSANRVSDLDPAIRRRLTVLRADRDELFSRLSVDLTRYERRRLPAEAAETGEADAAPSPTAEK